MFMNFGYFSCVGYHVPSISVARFVSTDTHRPMTLWPRRLLTLHTGLRRGVHKSQAPLRRGNCIFYSGAKCLWILSLGLASSDPSGA
jgi:hypothetical protein